MPTKKAVEKVKSPAAPKKAVLAKPIGTVTHFYSHLSVAIVKFKKAVKAGMKLHYKGATTDFTEVVKSMQYDHKAIETAKKGQEVGIKVKEKVREGDEVFEAE
jgi:putative protease